MKKFISKILLTVTVLFGGAMVADIMAPAAENVAMAACTAPTAANITAANGTINTNCDPNVNVINGKIFKFAYLIGGLVMGVSVVMIVYAGFKYATSQGDPKQTETAKMQIISAGIGLFIVCLAFVILNVFKTVM